jgi:hypothetical protein
MYKALLIPCHSLQVIELRARKEHVLTNHVQTMTALSFVLEVFELRARKEHVLTNHVQTMTALSFVLEVLMSATLPCWT